MFSISQVNNIVSNIRVLNCLKCKYRDISPQTLLSVKGLTLAVLLCIRGMNLDLVTLCQ